MQLTWVVQGLQLLDWTVDMAGNGFRDPRGIEGPYLITPLDGHDRADMNRIHALPHAAALAKLVATLCGSQAILSAQAIGCDANLAGQDSIICIVLEVLSGVQKGGAAAIELSPDSYPPGTILQPA